MKRLVTAVLLLWGIHSGTMVAEPGRYRPALASQFATCSAYLLVDAVLAKQLGRPDLEESAQDRARGWRAAAAALLDDGAKEPGAFARVQSTVDAAVEARLQDIGRQWNADPERMRAAARADFERVCVPLAPLQERLVELMKRPTMAATDRET